MIPIQTEIWLNHHTIQRVTERFYQESPEKILSFFKNGLAKIKKLEENKDQIIMVNEEENIAFKAMKFTKENKKIFLICTAFPLQQSSFYQIRNNRFENLQENDYSKFPLMFAGTNLYEKNIIKTELVQVCEQKS